MIRINPMSLLSGYFFLFLGFWAAFDAGSESSWHPLVLDAVPLVCRGTAGALDCRCMEGRGMANKAIFLHYSFYWRGLNQPLYGALSSLSPSPVKGSY